MAVRNFWYLRWTTRQMHSCTKCALKGGTLNYWKIHFEFQWGSRTGPDFQFVTMETRQNLSKRRYKILQIKCSYILRGGGASRVRSTNNKISNEVCFFEWIFYKLLSNVERIYENKSKSGWELEVKLFRIVINLSEISHPDKNRTFWNSYKHFSFKPT